ncbi:MAG: hypothetical protein D6743_01480 [Calditrichaeota bacterium]|nr:MAG: hypothetical protein D6743_01480 [Calditrichota bacterium]
MHLRKRRSASLILGLTLCLGFSCSVDHGLDPDSLNPRIKHGIRGRVTFRGAWPEEIAEARLIVSANFPPDADDPVGSFIFSDPIRFGTESLDYELTLAPGRYELVAVIIRERSKGWNISNVLAVYSQLPDVLGFLFPSSVDIENDTTIVDEIDLSVDLTKGRISGTVRFLGERKREIVATGIGVFENQPRTLFDFLNIKGLTLLPNDVPETSYIVRVPAGTYRAINVVAVLSLDPLDIRTIGTYRPPPDEPGDGVTVVSREETPGIDITADWSVINGAN